MHVLAAQSLLPQLHSDDCVCNLLYWKLGDGKTIGSADIIGLEQSERVGAPQPERRDELSGHFTLCSTEWVWE